MTDPADMVSVRYMVDDVGLAVAFYTGVLGFEVLHSFPAFADVARGRLRLLLSGPASSAGRPMADGERPGPGGWNRIHLIVEDIEAEVARLRAAGAPFRNEMVEGPGGRQILLQDPSGNLVELFQPAAFAPGDATSCLEPRPATEAGPASGRIRIKRIYEPAETGDGLRVLVDRLWPRGMSKAKAAIDLWLKEAAPSAGLRRWFDHRPDRWAEFQRRYRIELAQNPAMARLRDLAGRSDLTLLFAARDETHNHAAVLAACLTTPR